MSLRVVVSGSRVWEDRDLIRRVIYSLPDYSRIAHGAARGADRIADEYARARGFAVVPYPVDESLDGSWPAAGQRRNYRMIATERPDLWIGFAVRRADGSATRGTAGAQDIAKSFGIPTWLIWAS